MIGAEEAEANALVKLAENDAAEDKFEKAETCLKDLLKKA